MVTRENRSNIITYPILTTNWLMQDLYLGVETAATPVFMLMPFIMAVGEMFRETINLVIPVDEDFDQPGIREGLIGFESLLGVFSIMRGGCQIWNAWHFDKDTQTSTLEENSALKAKYYTTGLLDLMKGGVLIESAMEAQSSAMLTKMLPISMHGYLFVSAINSVIALTQTVTALHKKGCHSKEFKNALYDLVSQSIRLAGILLILSANPLGWLGLAAAGVMQGYSLFKRVDTYGSKIGFFAQENSPSNNIENGVTSSYHATMASPACGLGKI